MGDIPGEGMGLDVLTRRGRLSGSQRPGGVGRASSAPRGFLAEDPGTRVSRGEHSCREEGRQ